MGGGYGAYMLEAPGQGEGAGPKEEDKEVGEGLPPSLGHVLLSQDQPRAWGSG